MRDGLLMKDEKQLFEAYRRQHKNPSNTKPKKVVIIKQSDEDCRPREFEEF